MLAGQPAFIARVRDDEAQFLIAVGDVCMSAELAGLTVELLLLSGDRLVGVPRISASGDPVDAEGWTRAFTLDSTPVELESVARCTIHAPGA